MGLPNHEIRLDLRALELDYPVWMVNVTEPVRRDEGKEDAVEFARERPYLPRL